MDNELPPPELPRELTVFETLTKTRNDRVIFLAGAIFVSILVGSAVGIGTVLYLPSIAASLKAVSLAAALWSLYELLIGKFHSIAQFVRDNKVDGIRDPLSKMCVLATGLVLPIAPEVADVPTPPVQNMTVLSVMTDTGSGSVLSRDRIVVPFFGAAVTSCKIEEAKSQAADLKDMTRALQNVACGLKHCSSKAKPVVVDVRGFASDKEFTCEDQSSDSLNLAVAEARRDAIISALSTPKCEDESGTEIRYNPEKRPDRWNGDIEAMRRARGTDPSGVKGSTPILEALARRAEIVIESPGECSLGDLQEEGAK